MCSVYYYAEVMSPCDKDVVSLLLLSFLLALTELTGGINVSEWNSLFNGQLDGIDSLDPMTGIQNSTGGVAHGDQIGLASGNHGMGHNTNNGMDV